MFLLTLFQGIHVLLNNCPKLTHLSLTGVQAFLRDELLAFCREAPEEFNEHQRDVFCVFSGTGVGRLREFLNQQKAHAAAASQADGGSIAGTDTNSEMGDAEDMAQGSETASVLQVTVQGNHAPGATPVVPTPGLQQGGWVFQQPHQHPFGDGGVGSAAAGPSSLSQSAPASTPMFWSNGTAIPPMGLGLAGPVGGGHGAQQVTGMMGAAILDDVDEGDEAFGEGSEIMGEAD